MLRILSTSVLYVFNYVFDFVFHIIYMQHRDVIFSSASCMPKDYTSLCIYVIHLNVIYSTQTL